MSRRAEVIVSMGCLLFTPSHALNRFLLISKPGAALESVPIISPKIWTPGHSSYKQMNGHEQAASTACAASPRLQASSLSEQGEHHGEGGCLFKQLRPVCISASCCTVLSKMVSCVRFTYQWQRRLFPDGCTYFKATFLCRRKTV